MFKNLKMWVEILGDFAMGLIKPNDKVNRRLLYWLILPSFCAVVVISLDNDDKKVQKTMDTCVSDCPTLCKVAMDNPSNGMQCMWTCINQCQEKPND
jgi:hypothetical protein